MAKKKGDGEKKKPSAPKQDRTFILERNKRRRMARHQAAVSTHKRKTLKVPRGTARAKRRAQVDWHAKHSQQREKRNTGTVTVNGKPYEARAA